VSDTTSRIEEIENILLNTGCIERDIYGDPRITLRGHDVANHLINGDTATYVEYIALLRDRHPDGAKIAILTLYVNSALDGNQEEALDLLIMPKRNIKPTLWRGKYQSELFDSDGSDGRPPLTGY